MGRDFLHALAASLDAEPPCYPWCKGVANLNSFMDLKPFDADVDHFVSRTLEVQYVEQKAQPNIGEKSIREDIKYPKRLFDLECLLAT